jgi:hypothetical protein
MNFAKFAATSPSRRAEAQDCHGSACRKVPWVGGEVRNTSEVIAGRWSKLEVHRALWMQT